MTDQQQRILVLDTSVWINLLATEELERILLAINVPCVAPEQVLGEVIRDPVSKKVYTRASHPLRNSKAVRIEALSANELSIFLDLVGVPVVDRLGDGEAAAIAMAVSKRATLVIDEKKARRILRERYAEIALLHSGDLIRSDQVIRVLGQKAAKECERKAVEFGRTDLPLSESDILAVHMKANPTSAPWLGATRPASST